MAETHPEPVSGAEEFYIVRAAFEPIAALKLAQMAMKRMFDHDFADTSLQVPVTGLQPLRVYYSDERMSEPKPLTAQPLEATFTAVTDSVTANTATEPFGSISAFGAIRLSDVSNWNEALSGMSLDEIHARMALLHLEARQQASGLWYFEANTL